MSSSDRPAAAPVPSDTAPAPFDRAFDVLLIGLLAWLTFAFGGVLASSHVVVLAVALVLALLLGVRSLRAPQPVLVWTWAYVPIAAFVALVALQIAPLPRGVVAALSPEAARLWDAAGAEGAITLSVYPHATATDLRLLLAGAVLFYAVVQVYRRTARIELVLGAVAVIGAAAAVLGIAQDLTGTTEIYWTHPTPRGRALGGPFVHPGHFSQLVNLALGGALALLLVRLVARAPGKRLHVEKVFGDLQKRPVDLALLAFAVLGIVAIAMSESRNGVISMLVAGAATAAVLHRTRLLVGIGWALGGLAFVAFVVLLLLGFDPVYERMATLEDPGSEYSPRLALLRDTLGAAGAFPLAGTGLGTFALAFPMFDTSMRAGTAEHAENQYAELLAEAGVLGAVLAGLLALLVVRAWAQDVRRGPRPVAALACGLGFGVLAVAVHALTDFGLRVPAVAALTTVEVGLLVGLGTTGAITGRRARVAGAAAGFGAAALLAACLPSAIAAARAEGDGRAVDEMERQLAPPDFLGDAVLYDALLARAERAAALQPGNVDYRYWAAVHRWHATLAEAAGWPAPGTAPAPVAHTPALVAAAQRTQDALLAACRIAPTHGPSWSLAGQLGVEWLGTPEAASWIERGRALAPHHPGTCLAAARWLLREGAERTRVAAAFRRAIAMGAEWQLVLEALAFELQRPDVAREVARGDPLWVVWLERRLALRAEDDGVAADLREEARALLEQRCSEPGAPPWMFARLAHYHVDEGDDEGAVRWYRRYLTREPASEERFNLARALERTGQREAARKELRRLLAVHPQHAAGQRLLSELSGT